MSKQKILQIAPEDLIASDAPPPSKSLIKSVRLRGVVVAIIAVPVFKRGTEEVKGYRVEAGLRRRAAAIAAKAQIQTDMDKLDAKIKTAEGKSDEEALSRLNAEREELVAQLARVSTVKVELVDEHDPIITLAENASRRPNPIKEYEAIIEAAKLLMKEDGLKWNGKPITELPKSIAQRIAASSGMTPATIKKRLLIAKLPEEIKAGVVAGDIAVGTAEAVAKLDRKYHKKLITLYEEQGKLTSGDVRASRMVKKREITVRLPFGEMKLPGE